MQQHGLTVIAEVFPEKVNALHSLLGEIGHDIDENPHIDFYGLKTVHFLRWVIVPGAIVQGEQLPTQLVLSTNYDGKLDVHLTELVNKEWEGIRKIYSHCLGFPVEGNEKEVVAWLKKHSRPNAAFYVGTVGKGTQQIQLEQDLRDRIENLLQESNPAQDWQGKPPSELRKEVLSQVHSSETSDFCRRKSSSTFFQKWGISVLLGGLVLVLAAMAVAWIYTPLWSAVLTALVLFFFGFWFWRLRVEEERERREYKPFANVSDHIAHLNRREDFRVQNQITHLVDIKPGWVRQFAVRAFLSIIGLLARLVFNKGSLAGIRSIHFARWVIIDKGKRLLFFSNYDGSWESYLGEFIDRAAVGLTGVWSNTVGFPPTKNLVGDGARNSVEFKAWVRAQQIETQVWFSAYKTIGVDNIHNNTRIRNGLNGKMSESAARDWLQKL